MIDLFGNRVDLPTEARPVYIRVCVVCECAFDGNKYRTCPSGCVAPVAALSNRRHVAAIRAAEWMQEIIDDDPAELEVREWRDRSESGSGVLLRDRIDSLTRVRRW